MRILLADDQTQVLSALHFLLEQEPDLHIVGEALDWTALLEQAPTAAADFLLLDWELPGSPAPVLLARLRSVAPALKIIALSGRPEARPAALAAGAHAFVSKGDPPEQVLAALHSLSGCP